MRIWKIRFATLTVACSMYACSAPNTHDIATKDIATPGVFDQTNTLLRYEDNMVIAYKCQDGKPITPNFCLDRLATGYDQEVIAAWNTDINKDINLGNSERETEVARVSRDPKVISLKQTIDKLGSEIIDHKISFKSIERDIQDITRTIDHQDRDISGITRQLTEVNNRLASDPNSPELLKLKDQLTSDIQRLSTIRDVSVASLAQKQTDKQNAERVVLENTNWRNMNQLELNAQIANLNVTSPELDAIAARQVHLTNERNRFQHVWSELRDNALVFRTNTFSEIDQRIVGRILRVLLIKLSDGISLSDGILQVPTFNYDGDRYSSFTPVCDNNFDNNVAKVACRQLGLPSNNPSFKTGVYTGDSNNSALAKIVCTGDETSLFECQNADHNEYYCHPEGHGVYLTCN